MTDKSGIRLWLPLDRQLGPARRISRMRVASMADEVVEAARLRRHKSPSTAGGPKGAPWRKVLLFTAASIALPLAAAGVVYYSLERVPTPAAQHVIARDSQPPTRQVSVERQTPIAIHPGTQRP